MQMQDVTLAAALRSIRKERGWSLAETSAATGLSISALSKVENGQRSLTYDKLIALAAALDIDIARLFSSEARSTLDARGRRSVQRQDDGFVARTQQYTYRYLAEELLKKKFTPVIMELHASTIAEFGELLRHEGEEFAYVLEGTVDLHSEIYGPLRLSTGESVFFDSQVGHAYLRVGQTTARLLTIASSVAAFVNAENSLA